MTSNVAQRRGKVSFEHNNKNHTTILVPEEDNHHDNNHNHNNDINHYDSTQSSLLHVPNGDMNTTNTITNTNPRTITGSNGITLSAAPIPSSLSSSSTTIITTAKVRRNYCGTGPFDYIWLNLDCCGIFCAIITYLLLVYAIYVVTIILIPPWMNHDLLLINTSSSAVSSAVSSIVKQGINNTININDNTDTNVMRQMMIQQLQQQHRHILSYIGILHRFIYTCIGMLAIVSHWKAMTTDPGSVPPDAQPIQYNNNNNNNNTSGSDNTNNTNHNTISNNDTSSNDQQQLLQQEQQHTSALQSYLLEPPPSSSKPQQHHPNSIPIVKRICRKCKTYKPNRAHHCSICSRCIIKMDHHCPWINNCVGINNHKYFLLFIFYTNILCFYTLIFIILRFTSCTSSLHYHTHNNHYHNYHSSKLFLLHHPDQHQQQQHNQLHNEPNTITPHCLDRPTHLIYILLLLLESILFGLFTICMIMDQLDVVRSKVTHIDRYKGYDNNNSNTSTINHSITGIMEVFGTKRPIHNNTNNNLRTKRNRRLLRYNNYHHLYFQWDWLSPFAQVCFPSIHIRDEIIGFCRPCMKYNNHNNHTSSTTTTTNKKDITTTNTIPTPTITPVPLQASFMKHVATTSNNSASSTSRSSSTTRSINTKKSSMVEIV